jgi:PPOX class probable F420-dependent enzyme
MATVRPDGRPHVVPFVFALAEGDELRLYWTVDAKPKRSSSLQRLRNLERNPSVEVVVDGYDDDWRRLWWVRASGVGRVVADPMEREAAREALSAKYPQYRGGPFDGPVVAIDLGVITGWSAADAEDVDA